MIPASSCRLMDEACCGFAGNSPQTDDDYGDSDIWRMNVDGTGRRRLTSAPGSDTYPRLVPDGQRIVFTSHRDGNAELYVMHADGTGVRRITDHPAADDHAAWSRDGSMIVFTSWRTGLSNCSSSSPTCPAPRRFISMSALGKPATPIGSLSISAMFRSRCSPLGSLTPRPNEPVSRGPHEADGPKTPA